MCSILIICYLKHTHTHTYIRVIAFDRGRTMDDVCVSVCECVCMFVTAIPRTQKSIPRTHNSNYARMNLLATADVYIIVHNLQTRTFSIYPQTLFTGCNDA